jgi:hypothetical protein
MNSSTALCLMFGMVISSAATAQSPPPAQNQPPAPAPLESFVRPITQRISVQTIDGVPIADVPLGVSVPIVWNRAYESWSGFTDTLGKAERSARIDTLDRSLGVRLTGKVDPSDARAALVPDQRANLDDKLRRFAFLHWYAVPVGPGDETVDLPIRVRPAVTVNGTVSMPNRPRGLDNGAIAVVGYGRGVTSTESGSGRFSLRGVPKGVPFELAVWYGSQISFHRFEAIEADGPLAPIVVAEPTDLVPLAISLPTARPAGNGKSAQFHGAVLVRLDGQLVYQLRSGTKVNEFLPSDRLVGSFDIGITTERAAVPPGRYLVIPKLWTQDHNDTSLLHALRAGHDFSNSGIPIVTIAASATPQMIEIDWPAASIAADRAVAALLTAKLPELGPDPKPYVAPPVPPPAPPAPPPAPPGGGG